MQHFVEASSYLYYRPIDPRAWEEETEDFLPFHKEASCFAPQVVPN